MKKGQPLSQWSDNPEMSKQEITTARVFLVIGYILGIATGVILTVVGTLILALFK